MTSFFVGNNNNKKKSGWNTSVEQSMNIAIKIQITYHNGATTQETFVTKYATVMSHHFG
jgi:hypothetical protein